MQYDPWRKARVNDAPDAPESHCQQRSQPHLQTPFPAADNEDLGSAGYFRGLLVYRCFILLCREEQTHAINAQALSLETEELSKPAEIREH